LTYKKYKQQSKKTVVFCTLMAIVVGSLQTGYIVHTLKKTKQEQGTVGRNELHDGKRTQS